MSGFEVVGVFLSAAPLIIFVIEGYQRLGKKRDAFKKKSLHIDRMVRALNWQQKLIHSDVKIVLRNAGLDETIIDRHPGIGQYQDLLRRQDVEDAISSFLGDNCSAYLEIIQQCESTLLRITNAVKGFDEVTNLSLTGIIYAEQHIDKPGSDFWKRIKFCMHKDDLESSIKEIDEFSRLLERIREKGQQDHPKHSPIKVLERKSCRVDVAESASSGLEAVSSIGAKLDKILSEFTRSSAVPGLPDRYI